MNSEIALLGLKNEWVAAKVEESRGENELLKKSLVKKNVGLRNKL